MSPIVLVVMKKAMSKEVLNSFRNKVFTTKYEFEETEEVEAHLAQELIKINKKSTIEEEKAYLNDYSADLDIADVSEVVVNKYATVRVENNFYSVPEILVGRKVTLKNYLKDIEIYFNHKKVCEHKKKDGESEYIIDIMHYLRTFKSKPGALNNSAALINNPDLKTIFDEYYSTQPKEFIRLLLENKDKPKETLNQILLNGYDTKVMSEVIQDNILKASKKQLKQYNTLLKGSSIYGKH